MTARPHQNWGSGWWGNNDSTLPGLNIGIIYVRRYGVNRYFLEGARELAYIAPLSYDFGFIGLNDKLQWLHWTITIQLDSGEYWYVASTIQLPFTNILPTYKYFLLQIILYQFCWDQLFANIFSYSIILLSWTVKVHVAK